MYHQVVKQALIKAEWTITHDPFPLIWARRNLAIDLGAEQLLAAEKQKHKIAVEIKSFRKCPIAYGRIMLWAVGTETS